MATADFLRDFWDGYRNRTIGSQAHRDRPTYILEREGGGKSCILKVSCYMPLKICTDSWGADVGEGQPAVRLAASLDHLGGHCGGRGSLLPLLRLGAGPALEQPGGGGGGGGGP